MAITAMVKSAFDSGKGMEPKQKGRRLPADPLFKPP